MTSRSGWFCCLSSEFSFAVFSFAPGKVLFPAVVVTNAVLATSVTPISAALPPAFYQIRGDTGRIIILKIKKATVPNFNFDSQR
tara:strand:+ start:319 stop:570 length:252 start_codon:yes stop_codon:yes gene_type:complete